MMTEKEGKNMDKAFRKKLDGFVKEPPAHIWEGIQGQLAAKRREKRMFFIRWASAAALLILAFLAGWYLNAPPSRVALQEKPGNVEKQEQQPVVEAPADDLLVEEKETLRGEQSSPDQSPDATPARLASLTKKEKEPVELGAKAFAEGRSGKTVFAASAMRRMHGIRHPEVTMPEEQPTKGLAVTVRAVDHPVGETTGTGARDARRVAENKPAGREAGRKAMQKAHGWKMGIAVSPGYSSFSAHHSTTYAGSMTPDASGMQGNVCGGVSVQYKTGSRWSIESGVYYAQNGQESGIVPSYSAGNAAEKNSNLPAERLYFNTAVDMEGARMEMNSAAGVIAMENIPKGTEVAANLETSGNFTNSLLTRGELSQVFDFVEIPMYVRYLMIDSKMDVELVGGLSAGFVVGNNAFIKNEYGAQNIGKTRDISTLNFSGTVGVGIDYALGKHLSLAVEPRFNYYLHSINRNPEVDFRPYRVGVYTGLYYAF